MERRTEPEINKLTLDSYLNEIKSLRSEVLSLKKERISLVHQGLKYKAFADVVMNMSPEHGREGCTYSDTDYDSVSVAFGYNQCLESLKEEARSLTR